jgi:hypothetical protein
VAAVGEVAARVIVVVDEVAALELAVAVIVVPLPRITRIYFVKVPVRKRFKHC